MLFEIVGPVFKCADDEGIFFSRLYELPGYENVIGKGRNLYLNFSANPNEAVLHQLKEICNNWHTTFKPVN